MNILYGKCFGIGNAIMAIPAIKALQHIYPSSRIDILVGNTPDDIGAYQILSKVVGHHGKVYVSEALESDYDLAIMAIPFDGRWKNGIHFNAKKVMDGRTRPDPLTTGLISWKRHEIEYQMDNVWELGYIGKTPDCRFLPYLPYDFNKIYIGVGYKKDAAGFWKVKHWGNENYAKLISLILEKYPERTVVTTGDMADLKLSIGPISRLVSNKRFEFKLSSNIDEAFLTVASCGQYVGNDTGMMHVAASCDKKTVGLFFLENSIIKSGPWGSKGIAVDGFSVDRNTITPELIVEKFI